MNRTALRQNPNCKSVHHEYTNVRPNRIVCEMMEPGKIPELLTQPQRLKATRVIVKILQYLQLPRHCWTSQSATSKAASSRRFNWDELFP
jgi:hypothetical protein